MAVKRKKQKSIHPSIRRNPFLSLLKSIWILFGVGIATYVLFSAVQTPTRPVNFAACNDSGCQNVRNGNYWMITNCNSTDPDGDQQLCDRTGRTGLCRGVSYCCSAPGAQWTTNMAACPVATNTPVVPTSTRAPTNPPQATLTRAPSSTRAPTATRRPTSPPRPTSTPRPSITPTPTPIPRLVDECGRTCDTDADCKLDLTCTIVFGNLRACRNNACSHSSSCSCDSGTSGGPFTYLTPTPGPQTGDARTLPVTIKRFTNTKQQTGLQPTLSGTSEPDSKITLTIYPDGVGGEVYADKDGNWSYKVPKKLTPGEKSLLVVATKPGAQGQITQQFTVVGGGGISFGTILALLALLGLGFGVYVYVKGNR